MHVTCLSVGHLVSDTMSSLAAKLALKRLLAIKAENNSIHACAIQSLHGWNYDYITADFCAASGWLLTITPQRRASFHVFTQLNIKNS